MLYFLCCQFMNKKSFHSHLSTPLGSDSGYHKNRRAFADLLEWGTESLPAFFMLHGA